jgi:hypothetical protein
LSASAKSPDGRYDKQVAADLRLQRVKDSIATNPDFDYSPTRYFQAVTEAALVYSLFVDGRSTEYAGRLDMDTARSFFQFERMPHDFHRANHPSGITEQHKELLDIVALHPEIKPGKNNGTVNSFYTLPDLNLEICPGYTEYVNSLVYAYPNPTGALLKALNHNLDYLYTAFEPQGCAQVFPFGKSS